MRPIDLSLHAFQEALLSQFDAIVLPDLFTEISQIFHALPFAWEHRKMVAREQ